jgi:outer membrane receptor protein involved in Fe transport
VRPSTAGLLPIAWASYGYYIWEDGVRHNNGANSRNQGYYFQDQWQIHPRVTINGGLRIRKRIPAALHQGCSQWRADSQSDPLWLGR